MHDIALIFGLVVTGLALLVGHWFPWPRRLPRLGAYVYGVGALLLGQFIWLSLSGRLADWWALVGFAALGGLATCAAYAADALLNLQQRVKNETSHERDNA
jgi:fluoride ion exporter CrcB/FEX